MLKKLFLILKHRSIFCCPFCKGHGGEVSGYYEPEWTECHCCYEHYDELNDHGMEWFVGRVPLWVWIRAKVSIRCEFWFCGTIRNCIRCRMGWHYWMDESRIEPGYEVCACCYTARKNGVLLDESGD
jgi:hypothetical protein